MQKLEGCFVHSLRQRRNCDSQAEQQTGNADDSVHHRQRPPLRRQPRHDSERNHIRRPRYRHVDPHPVLLRDVLHDEDVQHSGNSQ